MCLCAYMSECSHGLWHAYNNSRISKHSHPLTYLTNTKLMHACTIKPMLTHTHIEQTCNIHIDFHVNSSSHIHVTAQGHTHWCTHSTWIHACAHKYLGACTRHACVHPFHSLALRHTITVRKHTYSGASHCSLNNQVKRNTIGKGLRMQFCFCFVFLFPATKWKITYSRRSEADRK